ncbi:e5e08d0d-3454-4405-aeb2-365dbff5eb0a [Thermothielavioides terrestris]|uniref:E5e08d0d-3454-4405-aeb2-365dbff5eb0a n=1 Tax=Thermothielavioides terrestris TaxID=2587410 RepID=A0A3S4AP62_9PEZI|nr:e5e08d0d-3454-4405-aeb2-365dbff5eb0a [Thermothielavioides terrestris]
MGLNSDSPASSTWPPHSGRKGSKKVRTGCITCKIRKVKCDEAKPYCMRCTKTGRRCDGYLDAKSMAQRRRRPAGPVVSAVAGRPQASTTLFYDWASSDERRAFHFFQHVTAPSLSGGLDDAFWRVLVLQICQAEPAVRHAVLAVSSLHEGMVQATMMAPYANTEDRSSFALYQYNRAIACLLGQMRTVDARPLVPLLTCVLFVCIELMQSKDRESLLHLEQGRQILNQLGRKEPPRSAEIDLIKQHLVPMYTRLSLTSLMFGGEPVEIPTPLKTLTEVPMVFETIDEVRYALYDFMDECLRFAKKTHSAKLGSIPAEEMRAFEKEQAYLLRKLAKFNVAFSLYRSTSSRDAPPGSIALIQIHAHTTFIWVSTALSQRETVFDDYVDTFSAIIPLATDFINSLGTPQTTSEQSRPTANTRRFTAAFTFEIHIIAPLYFVAAKCRHPIIRRAALDLLRRSPARRENLWRANVMATIAERTMRLEEKHLRDANSQPQSRHPSPPEIPMLFSGSLGHEGDPWLIGPPEATFPDVFGGVHLGSLEGAASNKLRLGSLEACEAPVTSSCSNSSTTGSADVASLGDLAGHLPIDPTLFFDPTEGSTAHSFSAAPSIASSIDDLGVPAAISTPYLGASVDAPSPTDLWSGAHSHQPAPPGIALEPPTPLDASNNPFIMPPHPHPRHSHSQPQSRSHSRQPSRSGGPSSVGSDGSSPPLHPMGSLHELGQSPTLHATGMPGFQQAQYHPTLGVSAGQLSPTTGKRSADAPFDVPERFRVHESIIGPDREDGTSWVMLFRKLGGLDAEWDVLTEYVAVA